MPRRSRREQACSRHRIAAGVLLHGWLAGLLPCAVVASVGWISPATAVAAVPQSAPAPGSQTPPPAPPAPPPPPVPVVPGATQEPAPQPAATGAAAAAAAGVSNVMSPSLVFGSEAGIVINPIKPDKAADFELLIARLRDALQQSTDPVRRSQAASWRILKAAEPGPAGAVLYLFVLDPVVKDADYTMSHVFAEAFPDEVPDLWARLREAYAGGMFQLSLEAVKAPEPSTATSPKK